MGEGQRQSLDFGVLNDFQPRPQRSRPPNDRKAIDQTSAFPSREAGEEGQINIKGDRDSIERFRAIAKRDGLRLIGLLSRALDAYERGAG